MSKKKPSKTNRKNRVFSVSFRDQDLEEIEKHIDGVNEKSGYSPTRNELIRRATLAHIRHKEDPSVPYDEVFKSVQ